MLICLVDKEQSRLLQDCSFIKDLFIGKVCEQRSVGFCNTSVSNSEARSCDRDGFVGSLALSLVKGGALYYRDVGITRLRETL